MNITEKDKQVIEYIRKNDVDAGSRILYTHCFDEVVNDIEYRGGNFEDGCDIFQEAVLVLIKKIQGEHYKPESTLKTFLKGIARNLWMAEQRSRNRRKAREQEYISGNNFHEMPGLWRSPAKEFSALLNSIGETCKNLLLEYYLEGTDTKSLTEKFGFKTEQVLRNRKSICMKKLKDLVHQKKHLFESLLTDSYYE
jgi:RNA polymerase sigma factor (sigma-70 family)